MVLSRLWKRTSQKYKQTQSRIKRPKRRLDFDHLEDRVVPTLMISLQEAGVNGGLPTVVGTASDFSAVAFSGTYGDFKVSIFGGSSDNGTTLSDLLSATTSIQNIGASTATLTMTVFQDNYTLPTSSSLNVESGLGGTVNQGTLSLGNIFQAYASSTNNANFDFTNGPQSAQANGASYDTGGQNGVFNRVAGQPYALCSTVTINLSAGGKINYSDHVNVTAAPSPDVDLTKVADAHTVDAGAKVGFTVTLRNEGAGDATNVSYSDPLPSGLGNDIVWSIDTQSLNGNSTSAFSLDNSTAGSQHLLFSPTTIKAGDTYVVHITGTSTKNDADSSTLTGTITNDATVTVGNEQTPDMSGDHEGKDTITIKDIAIGDFVWNDVNSNGIQNSGEPGIQGVKLTLTGTDSSGNSVTDHATTDSNGKYLFVEAPGTYTVSIDNSQAALSGYTPTTLGQGTTSTDSNPNPTSGISPPAGTSDLTIDFGYINPDVDLTKVADKSSVDAGAAVGFTVTLKNEGGSDATGVSYSDPLPAGLGNDIVWSIQSETLNGNSTSAFSLDNSTAGSQHLLFNPTTIKAGDTYVVHITGTSTKNDADFTTLTGTITNDATVTVGNEQTPDMSGDHEGKDTITIKDIAIGDFVWNDVNSNGIQNSGEPGIQGVKLTLTGTDSSGHSVTDHATTDSSGKYLFVEAPGTYTVSVDASNLSSTGPLFGWTPSPTLVGSDRTIDSNPNPSSGISPAAGTSDLTIDFGYDNPDVDVTKVADKSTVDAGAQVGFTVTLTNEGTSDAVGVSYSDALPAGLGTDIVWSIDSQSGPTANAFSLDNSTAGSQHLLFSPTTLHVGDTYTVHITGTSTKADGNLNGTLQGSITNTATVTVSNETTPDNPNDHQASDKVTIKDVAIGDFVWNDTNQNGIQNSGEAGISGVKLTLTGTDSSGHSVADHATTDSNGKYLFTEAPGTYTVTVDASNFTGSGSLVGYTASPTLQGSDRTVDSNANPSGTSPSALLGGSKDLTIDFGYYTTPSSPVGAGAFATIGFWHNQNGQAVILSFNGGANPQNNTQLGNWLATNFPHLFGTGTTWDQTKNPYISATLASLPGKPTSLAGLTNAQIATVYANLWNPSGVTKNTYVQAFAVALGMYADNGSLGYNSTAAKYGFKNVSGGGGNNTFNIGGNTSAFPGLGSNPTVLQILTALDANFNPCTGLFYGGDQTKTSAANNVVNGINTKGDITLLADGSTVANYVGSLTLLGPLSTLNTGTLVVAVDPFTGDQAGAEQARLDDALATLNSELATKGVNLIEISSTDPAAIDADIFVHMADTTSIGGVADGVLGVTEFGRQITLVNGWNFYLGADPSAVGAGQYDFQTVVTHELGHALGLGHSPDQGSVMFPFLGTGEARRDLTAADLAMIDSDVNAGPEPLLAGGFVAPGERAPVSATSVAAGETVRSVSSVNAQPQVTGIMASAPAGQSMLLSSFASLSQATSFSAAPLPAGRSIIMPAAVEHLTMGSDSTLAASQNGLTSALDAYMGEMGSVEYRTNRETAPPTSEQANVPESSLLEPASSLLPAETLRDAVPGSDHSALLNGAGEWVSNLNFQDALACVATALAVGTMTVEARRDEETRKNSRRRNAGNAV